MNQKLDTSDASTDLNEEDRIANITLNGDFDALKLYSNDRLVWNHIDGDRIYEIVDWQIVDISLGEDTTEPEPCDRYWIEDQLNGVGDYELITANGVSEIVFEDSIGVKYTVSLNLDRLN